MDNAALQIIAIHTAALCQPIETRERYITDQLAVLMAKIRHDNPIRTTSVDTGKFDHAALALAPNFAVPKPATISGRRK